MLILRILLIPVSYLYGFIIHSRNLLFDWNILKSKTYPLSSICVGNIEIGGTGKTPHVEYLIRLLKDKYSVVTLSRGYGRKTKGFVEADETKTYKDIGDEPMLFFTKYPDVKVYVDEKRTRGVEKILKDNQKVEVVLLDDCYQHRWIKAGLNILLLDYHNIDQPQYMLPSGRLREFKSGMDRADIVIVTKGPSVFSPIENRRVSNILQLKSWQKLFFSYISYKNLVPFTSAAEQLVQLDSKFNLKEFKALVFAGIAKMDPLVEYMNAQVKETIVHDFSDHHNYSVADVVSISNSFKAITLAKKIIVTTEKDAMRLIEERFSSVIEDLPMFYIPIEVGIHQENNQFDSLILEYVKRDKKSATIHF
jgi:tetraacyldisaccharide 4'-kinase